MRCSWCRSRDYPEGHTENHGEAGCAPEAHGGPQWSRCSPAAQKGSYSWVILGRVYYMLFSGCSTYRMQELFQGCTAMKFVFQVTLARMSLGRWTWIQNINISFWIANEKLTFEPQRDPIVQYKQLVRSHSIGYWVLLDYSAAGPIINQNQTGVDCNIPGPEDIL